MPMKSATVFLRLPLLSVSLLQVFICSLNKKETGGRKNKDEHYWEPYRPYQQIASPDDNSEAAEKNPETFSSQDNISSENSIPSENTVLSENKKDTSSSE
jgi:hypothetical protein